MTCDPMTASLLPYAPERDVYRLLQVDPTASDQEIAIACRRLALAFHPDRNRSPRAHEEMQIVNAVRSLVSDPRARAAYDGARRRFLYYGERTWAPARRAAATPTWVTRHVASHPVAVQVTPFEPRTPFMPVKEVRENAVVIGEGEAQRTIPTRTVIWTAGVRPSPLVAQIGVDVDRAGRAITDPSM